MRYIYLIMLIFLMSCTTPQISPYTPPPISYKEKPSYSSNEILESIPKPKKIKVKYIKIEDNKITITNIDEATHILLTKTEYNKIASLVILCKTYKNIIKNNDVLININIDTINKLQEQVILERINAMRYRDQYIEAEFRRRQEIIDHKTDNLINKILITIESLTIIILGIALI